MDASRANRLQLASAKIQYIFFPPICNLSERDASKVAKKLINHLKQYSYDGFYYSSAGCRIHLLGIYALFELFVRRKERLLIIEKISERMDIADLGKRLSLPSYSLPRFSFSSLKTGCLLMGIGLGILVGFFCNLIVAANSHSLDFRNEYEAISQLMGASVLFVWRFGD